MRGAAEIGLAASVGGAAGGASAAVIMFAVARRRLKQWLRLEAEDDFEHTADEFPEEEARHVAREWSRHAGEPGAEGLITERLRVGWAAQQRRARRRRH